MNAGNESMLMKKKMLERYEMSFFEIQLGRAEYEEFLVLR